MSEAEIDPRAAEAEAYLRANGVEGITIKGGGEDWFVSVGFAEHERFVTAYSGRNPLTPNDPVYLAQQALATLIRNERPAKLLAQESEAGETPRTYDEATTEYFELYPEERPSESDSETGEETDGGLAQSASDISGIIWTASDTGDVGTSDDGPYDEGAGGVSEGDDSGAPAVSEYGLLANDDDQLESVTDAEFEESPSLGAELLEDADFTLPELPAPEPEDFAPDEIEPEPEHSPGAFIFGDNLAHDRIVRIGQLSEYATELIAAAKVGYSDAEHDAVRSHVVTHLNEAGAYVGGNPKLFDRFIELETVTGRIRRIEIYRDERQDFIRSADREAVAAFEPETGWP